MDPCKFCGSTSWDSTVTCTDCGGHSGFSLEKLSLQPGEFLIWRFSKETRCHAVAKAFEFLRARVAPGVHVIALVDDNKLEKMSAEQLVKLGLQPIPKP